MITQTGKDILSEIPKDFGCTWDYIKDEIKKTVQNGRSETWKSPRGYSIFLTMNDNFQGGLRNGYGAGYYARIKKTCGIEDILLERTSQ